MTFFERVKRAFSSKSTPGIAALRRLAEQAEADIVRLREELGALEDGHRVAIFSGDGPRSASHEKMNAVRADLADTEAALLALNDDIQIAERQAEEDQRRALFDAAIGARTEACEALKARYPAAAAEIIGLIEVVAHADAMIEAVNVALPTGMAPLDDVETVARNAGTRPKRILAETMVDRWADELGREPLPDRLQDLVEPDLRDPRRGAIRTVIPVSALADPARLRGSNVAPVFTTVRAVVLKKFRRTELEDGVAGQMPEALMHEIKLPALVGGQPDLWAPMRGWSSPEARLEQIKRLAVERRQSAETPPSPTYRVEHTLIVDDEHTDKGVAA